MHLCSPTHICTGPCIKNSQSQETYQFQSTFPNFPWCVWSDPLGLWLEAVASTERLQLFRGSSSEEETAKRTSATSTVHLPALEEEGLTPHLSPSSAPVCQTVSWSTEGFTSTSDMSVDAWCYLCISSILLKVGFQFWNVCWVMDWECDLVGRVLAWASLSFGFRAPAQSDTAVLVHACYPSSWEVEMERLGVQGHPQLCISFEVSGLQETFSQKRPKQNKNVLNSERASSIQTGVTCYVWTLQVV